MFVSTIPDMYQKLLESSVRLYKSIRERRDIEGKISDEKATEWIRDLRLPVDEVSKILLDPHTLFEDMGLGHVVASNSLAEYAASIERRVRDQIGQIPVVMVEELKESSDIDQAALDSLKAASDKIDEGKRALLKQYVGEESEPAPVPTVPVSVLPQHGPTTNTTGFTYQSDQHSPYNYAWWVQQLQHHQMLNQRTQMLQKSTKSRHSSSHSSNKSRHNQSSYRSSRGIKSHKIAATKGALAIPKAVYELLLAAAGDDLVLPKPHQLLDRVQLDTRDVKRIARLVPKEDIESNSKRSRSERSAPRLSVRRATKHLQAALDLKKSTSHVWSLTKPGWIDVFLRLYAAIDPNLVDTVEKRLVVLDVEESSSDLPKNSFWMRPVRISSGGWEVGLIV